MESKGKQVEYDELVKKHEALSTKYERLQEEVKSQDYSSTATSSWV